MQNQNNKLNDEDAAAKQVKADTAARRAHTAAMRTIWKTRIIEDDPNVVEARKRWRSAMGTCAMELKQNSAGRLPKNHTNAQAIETMARTCTLTKSSYAVMNSIIPERQRHTGAAEREKTAFARSGSRSVDRQEYISWLGHLVGRSTWRDQGRGSAPLAVAAAACLMRKWAAIGWRGRDTPDWFVEGVSKMDREVYLGPSERETNLYRSWDDIKSDVHCFLQAWEEGNATRDTQIFPMGNIRSEISKDAIDMAEQVFWLRALDATNLGIMDPNDGKILKKIVRSHGVFWESKEFATILSVLEDRKQLEMAMAKIKSPQDCKTDNNQEIEKQEKHSIKKPRKL